MRRNTSLAERSRGRPGVCWTDMAEMGAAEITGKSTYKHMENWKWPRHLKVTLFSHISPPSLSFPLLSLPLLPSSPSPLPSSVFRRVLPGAHGQCKPSGDPQGWTTAPVHTVAEKTASLGSSTTSSGTSASFLGPCVTWLTTGKPVTCGADSHLTESVTVNKMNASLMAEFQASRIDPPELF